MFKVLLTLLFFILLSLTCTPFFHTPKNDFAFYQKLVESSDPSKTAEILSYSQQKRERVSKEIWYRAETPLNFYIESAESELFFFQQSNQIEVIEQLENVQTIMQEELYYILKDGREATLQENGKLLIRGEDPLKPSSWLNEAKELEPMQTIRFVEAEKACYNYNTQLFLAQNVTLRKYKVRGHHQVRSFENEIPLMSGKARSVEFTLKGKKLEFQAEKLHATFNPKEESL